MSAISAFDAVGLTAMFVLCATLLLWIVIGARGWWWIKTPVISATLFFGIAVWYSVDSYLGWPSPHDPPRKFIVQWIVIDEPSKTTDDPGAIYLMLKKLPHPDDVKYRDWKQEWFQVLAYVADDKSPRLHKVPYSRALHEEMSRVLGMLRQGKKMVGEFKGGKFGAGEEGEGQGGGKGKGKGDGDGKGNGGYQGDNWGLGDFHFYQLPPPKHMPKTN